MQAALGRIEALTLAVLGWARRGRWRQALLLAVLALVALLPGLADLPPTDRDESRYIQASRQMLESGDFVDIRFQDQPRWKKPAGIYWLQAAAALPFGGPEAPVWAWRLPSALAILVAGLATAWALAPATGRAAALVAAAMTASCVMAVVEGHLAKTDAVLLALTVVAMGALARILIGPPRPAGAMHLLFWAGLGAGILVKGPVILIPAGGAVLWHCVAARGLGPLWRTRPLVGIPVLALVTLPWAVAIWLRTDGAFFSAAVGGDLLAKLGEGAEGHWGPPGYYLATVWASFWPWAPLLVLAAGHAWRTRSEPGVRFLLGWAVPSWLMFEAAATKLPHYVLPVFPALAGLIALWLVAREKPVPPPGRLLVAAGLFAVPGLVLALAAIFALPMIEGTAAPAAIALGLAAILLLAAGARALVERRLAAFLGAATLAALCLYPAIFQFTLPRLDKLFISPRLVEARARFDACSDRPLAIVGYYEPSLVVAAGTDARRLSPEEALALLRAGDGWLIFVEEGRGLSLQELVDRAGVPLSVLAAVDGFNYNRGARTTIFLVARSDDPAIAPCLSLASGGGR